MDSFCLTYAYSEDKIEKTIVIENHDIKKLLPSQYLNDTILNFFLK